MASRKTTTANPNWETNSMPIDTDDRGRRNQDMVLTSGEFVHITDQTKGEVNIYVGPTKQSLGSDDKPVVFNSRSNRFEGAPLTDAIQAFATASEGSYIVLENPAEGDKHPTGNGKLSPPSLRTGKRVNTAGPATFALWPGQSAKVIPGHNLRSNEYLLCRVYDEEAAKQNVSKAVIKASEGSNSGTDMPSAKDLTMGKLFIVRGTEVSFYMPPTGIEVVPEVVSGEERYVREANTLERLEYCLLVDQSGDKRYEQGPAVVFPKPTEKFVEAAIKSNPDGKVKAKKFRAQELTPKSGIHIRVITGYTEPDGTKRAAGEELFVTGATTPVYFPREEHAIIKYGEQDVHYGIAIPASEGRYVLNRESGEVPIVKGPQIFLPDPRTQVIAQRALPLDLCALIYPGNSEALEVNAARLNLEDQDVMGVGGANAAFLNSSYARSTTENENYGAVAAAVTPDAGRRGIMIKGSSKSLPGDSFDRKAKFTAPRSVILNTKYDGVVSVRLWSGFAMLLIRGNERRVIQGPGTFMLEYDEVPQVITLSTGKPKTMDKPFRTVYLQTTANMVSDIIEVETRDFCRLNVKVSYRVNFEGPDPMKWFSIDNYVKFLTDHLRSKLRNAVQKLGIEEFYGSHVDVVRDIVLGKAPSEGAPRQGALFPENNMRVYDVEVLGVKMQNADVEKLLVSAQRDVIQNTLLLATERRKLSFVKENEELKRQTAKAQAETRHAGFLLAQETANRKLALDLANLEASSQTEAQRQANLKASDAATAEIVAAQHQRGMEVAEDEIALAAKRQELELAKLTASVEAVVSRAEAITPDLIAALQAFGDKALLERVAESMAPMALITGGKKSVVEAFADLIRGTDMAKNLESLSNSPRASK